MASKALHDARRLLEQCVACGAPATRGVYCQRHKEMRLRWNHNHGVQPTRKRCGRCRLVGHYRKTCPT